MKEYYCEKTNYRIIQDYRNSSNIRMHRKMETDWVHKIYKKQPKTADLHTKTKHKTTRITKTGFKNTNTEFKLYTIGNNLKRIYNEINRKKNN